MVVRSVLTMASLKRTIIYLFQNDLRLHDNECLNWAQKNCDHLIPLFCFQPAHFKGTHNFKYTRTAVHRAKFLIETVTDLRKNLQKIGSHLIIRQQSSLDAVSDLIELCSKSASPIHSIVYQKEITSEETDLEAQLGEICLKNNVTVKALWGLTLYHRDDIPYNERTIPDTYTKFRQGVETKSRVRPLQPELTRLNSLPPVGNAKLGDIPQLTDLGFKSNDLVKDARSAIPFVGGETSALERLKNYLWDTDAIATYKETRNGLVGEDYSTKFSIWLANGSLSPRKIFHEVKKYESEKVSNQSTYWTIFELIWRDYFKFVGLKYGSRMFLLSGIMDKHIPWKKDKELFEKWSKGETGVPFVDANMRELLHTGWMSNRGRQNVASFLVKDLCLDWRMGAEWFESMLIDHDVCSNYGNWNYAAGIGNDPRQGRKFNMIKQALDYDGDGEFVKTWIPELKNLPRDKVHIPWTIPARDWDKLGITLGHDYPNPVLIAPEWDRHTHKSKPHNARPQNAYNKPNRGIDFYFKNNDKK